MGTQCEPAHPSRTETNAAGSAGVPPANDSTKERHRASKIHDDTGKRRDNVPRRCDEVFPLRHANSRLRRFTSQCCYDVSPHCDGRSTLCHVACLFCDDVAPRCHFSPAFRHDLSTNRHVIPTFRLFLWAGCDDLSTFCHVASPFRHGLSMFRHALSILRHGLSTHHQVVRIFCHRISVLYDNASLCFHGSRGVCDVFLAEWMAGETPALPAAVSRSERDRARSCQWSLEDKPSPVGATFM
jgi:hypothetical protein